MSKKENQTKFLKAYAMAFGNITKACEAAGIDRGTYYLWRNGDEAFVKKLEQVEPEEMFVDFAESALISRIRDKDTTAIIFALKTKGKKRGYVEKTEQDITVNKVEVEFV